MVSGPSYKRIGTNGDGLLFKYKLAKALTIVSLIAVILMAIGSLVYPRRVFFSRLSFIGDDATTTTEDDNNTAPDVCILPDELYINPSEDGTYTPPGPDTSLLNAIQQASAEDIDSYCRNVFEPEYGFNPATPYNEKGECGTWQEEYTALHQRRLQQMELIRNGQGGDLEEEPLFVSYLCKEVPVNGNRGCGGTADRMSGMISTFFYGLLTDRAYLAHWADANPIPLETLFEKPHIDWSYKPEEMKGLFDNKELGFTYQQVDTLNQKYPVLGNTLFPDGPLQNFDDLWNGTFVEIRSNRGYIIRTFKQSAVYPKVLAKMGLTKQNTFGCLTDYLFRPTVGSRRFINAYRHLFDMKSVLSIGMQIRTDDNALANPQFDKNDLDKWDYFLTCANQLADAKRKPHHKHVVYFMITDSLKLRDEFKSLNEDPQKAKKYLGANHKTTSTIVTGLQVDHIEPDQVEKYIHVENPVDVTIERMTPGTNSAIIENWLLGYADYRIISPQGYGKLAAFHSKSDDSTISLPRADRKDKAPFCGSDDALTTYDWLATQWSLG
ncbi:hypothetical protein BDB00DRAFT_961212 [Zychaea mexicana]|uniref:uncharacterized protein n=1 Tax=Zychaea mexicana TaxID=64656 RepID=UPI0022FEAD9C|nr:uncharacterized protein BDB00DRAFT_961212 [Zychaea mexicana]KAI9490185.1 hypothetical protein BDB00DRAFT_961212 [Zychaea mexicana]